MKKYLYAMLVFLTFQAASTVMGENAKTLITAGPSWERFTNVDGHGLYHDLIRLVFAGYQVTHLYVPTVQANSMVAIGRADIKMCETKEIASLVLGKVPMYENDFYALFLRERFDPWQGSLSLEGKKAVWREGYYSGQDFSVPLDFIEVRTGESALQMVIHGRADFYVDDRNLIQQSFDAAGERFEPTKFRIESVGTRRYFPVFASTSRGNTLRKHYENEMERLYREGKLRSIYDRWGFSMPKFTFNDSDK